MKRNNKTHIYRSFQIILLVSFVFSCFTGQKRIPENRIIVNMSTSKNTANLMTDDMAGLHSQKHSFQIDRYEVSELGEGDFFAIKNQIPRVNVSAQEAQKICRQFGKRLCTYNEWNTACVGIQQQKFSYGNKAQKNTCNLLSNGLKRTGLNSECRSDANVHDLIGNAMEWVADTRSGQAIAVGGSFNSNLRTDCFSRSYFPTGSKHRQIGFRCCK